MRYNLKRANEMERLRLNKVLVLSVLVCVSVSFSASGAGKVVWRIGVSDDNTAEFAIGPDKSNQYSVTFPHGALTRCSGAKDTKCSIASYGDVALCAKAIGARIFCAGPGLMLIFASSRWRR